MENNKENKKKVLPVHVGIIIDGNRRWAKERNLPTLEGHLAGYKKLKLAPNWFFLEGVKILSFFIFSTENWQRSQDEVNYLMKLTKIAIEEDFEEMNNKGYKILFSGRLDELPGDLPELCRNIITKSQNNNKATINICLNYGGRAEIIDVVRKMVKNKVEAEQVHEGMIRKYLYQPDLPDPDIIVRTSGEQRISNFLMWESAYSELMFIQKYWPDFEKSDVELIINEYGSRQRRLGK